MKTATAVTEAFALTAAGVLVIAALVISSLIPTGRGTLP